MWACHTKEMKSVQWQFLMARAKSDHHACSAARITCSPADNPRKMSHHTKEQFGATQPRHWKRRLTAFVNRVRIGIGIREPVVCAVTPAPETDRALESAGTTKAQEDLEGQSRGISTMGPKPMVSCGDTNAGPEVQQDGEDQCGALQWRVVRVVAGYYGDEDE